jgi:hypothetical protein
MRIAAVVGRRICAALAAVSAALHGLSLVDAPNAASGGFMVVMIAVCLNCARRLWLRGAVGDWTIIAMMNLAMIAVHMPAPGHHHSAAVTAAVPMPLSTAMGLATVMAAVEAVIAATVLYYRTQVRPDPERAKLANGRAS